MIRDAINNDYFNWLVDSVSKNRYGGQCSFNRLLEYLHTVPFRYHIARDKNRANDGISLRHRYSLVSEHKDATLYLDGACSVLEMMVALAIRCEEDIMSDPTIGDRTRQWFWGMIVNLGLGDMEDSRFDIDYVEYAIDRFLDREYEADGRYGLFTVKNCEDDLRTVEIWYQLCWYLDSIT